MSRPAGLPESYFPMMNNMEKYVIGMDIGGTNLRAGAVDSEGNVHGFKKLPVGEVLKSPDVMGDLAGFLSTCMQGLEIEALCLGFPATLDKKRKVVLQAPNIPHMENLAVADKLAELLGLPVLIERDVNLCMCYDMAKYNIPPEGVACGFYFGTGIGNAIFIDGKPYVGRHGAAGELGHIPADGSEELCGCGNLGCMENLAGGKYLIRCQKEKWPDCPPEELFIRHGEELKSFVDRMAQTVCAELNILDPDHVIIGGGVSDIPGFPKDHLAERIYARCRKPYPADELKLIFADEDEKKGVIGAAIYKKMLGRS